MKVHQSYSDLSENSLSTLLLDVAGLQKTTRSYYVASKKFNSYAVVVVFFYKIIYTNRTHLNTDINKMRK